METMNKESILQLARQLMDEHGLNDWSIRSNQKVRTAGSSNSYLKRITLSMKLLTIWNPNEVKDTILHEIAHALTDEEEEDHGSVWKSVCRRIGARPEAKYEDMPNPASPYRKTCKRNCEDTPSFRRKPRTRCNLCGAPILYYKTGQTREDAQPHLLSALGKKCITLAESMNATYEVELQIFSAPAGHIFTATGSRNLNAFAMPLDELYGYMEYGVEKY